MTPAVRLLEIAGIECSVHEYEHDGSLRDFGREAADALGLDPDSVFKTLVVTVHDAGGATREVVAVAPVSCQVALKAVASAVGAKRAEMCERQRVERLTGYVIGGVSPLGQKRRLPTVVDESALLFETVYVSGGRRGLDIGLAPANLIRATDATVADITVADITVADVTV